MTTGAAKMRSEVLARFGLSKHAADLSSILPSVAGAPVGGYLGYLLGSRYGQPQLGGMLGGVTGGVLGKVISEAAQEPRSAPSAIPPGAPFAIDPTAEDIPPWALAGAQLMRPHMDAPSPQKTGAAEQEGFRDAILGDMLGPAYPVAEGWHAGGPLGAFKHLAGSSAGLAAGGALGYGVGQLLPRASVWGVPLSTLMTGLGATIGGVKGLQVARRGLSALRGG